MSKVLHNDEVVTNVFLFMVAGYETTSTALAYCTYVLAKEQDVQDKLIDEINQTNWDDIDGEKVYETAMDLSYLDLFIREVLRMYPLASKPMSRECNTTATVCGYTIEKGSFIRSFEIICNLFFSLQERLSNLMCSVFIMILIYGVLKIQICSYLNDMKLNVIHLHGCRLVSVREIALV